MEYWLYEREISHLRPEMFQHLPMPELVEDCSLKGESEPLLTGLKSVLGEWAPGSPLKSPLVTVLFLTPRNIFKLINKINDKDGDNC